MTLQKLLVEGIRRLHEAGVEEAQLDARYLLMEAFEMSFTEFLVKRGNEADERQDIYWNMLEKRCSRVPLQYIIGKQTFMGMEFTVDERVLIPRQDTEDLVELILKEHPRRDQKILDMCTGSGCIAVSLARLGDYEHVAGVDISQGALDVMIGNAQRLGVGTRTRGIRSDLFEQAEAILKTVPGGYDIIVSNPPYIPTEIIAGLEPEVKDYEPMLALDGTDDGLYFYRILSKESKRFLRAGGYIYLEIGHDQGEAVSGLLAEAGYVDIKVLKDTPGLDRIVKANYIGGSHV